MLFNFTFYSSVSLIFLLLYSRREFGAAKACVVIYTILITIWLWVVLSFREPVGDPWRYMQGLDVISKMSFSELLSSNRTPLGFRLLNWFTAFLSKESEFYFTVIYIFCVGPLYRGLREKFSTFDTCALLMVYLLYPFYLLYLGGGFKQGIGFGFSLWGITCLIDRVRPKWSKGLTLLFISTLFHSSFWLVNMAVLSLFLFFRNKSVNLALYLLLFSAFLAVAGIVEPLVTSIVPKALINSLGFNEYFDGTFYESAHFQSLNYKSGFRIDFAAFTIAPMILFFYLWKKGLINILPDIVKVYCLLGSVYFLFCFIPFSDRIASFSWMLIPLLIYENFKINKNVILQNYFITIFVGSYPLLLLTYSKRFFE